MTEQIDLFPIDPESSEAIRAEIKQIEAECMQRWRQRRKEKREMEKMNQYSKGDNRCISANISE